MAKEAAAKNVTVTMASAPLQRARVIAARDGEGLSRFVVEAVEQRVGRSTSQSEALGGFLAGPSWSLLDESGKAPMRAQLYDDG